MGKSTKKKGGMLKWLVVIVVAIIVFGCGCGDKKEKIPTNSVGEIDWQALFINGIDKKVFSNPYCSGGPSEGEPSSQEIDLYNEIIDQLNDFSRPEDEIITEIAPNYGMTDDELKEFMYRVMPYAVGEKSYESVAVPTDEQIVNMLLDSMPEITTEYITYPNDTDAWNIEKTIYRYLIKVDVECDGNKYETIIKIEFDMEYKEYKIFQLKVDNVNIDL